MKTIIFLTGLFIVFLCLVFTVTVIENHTKRECWSLGYPEYRVSRMLYQPLKYCVARENMSDIIVPLEEARRRPRR